MRVTLNHSTHTYTDNKRQPYIAVSSVIARYKQKFDAQAIQKNGKTLIANYVEKNGQSEQYWLEVWERNKDFACERGTAFHNLKELYVNGQAIRVANGKAMPVRNLDLLWSLPEHEGMFHLLPPGVYTELCIWNYRHKIAGTADLVTIYPNREFDIEDYKTNGKFKTESFMGKTMKWPFVQLPDCHLGHYTIQLSLYAWMLEQFGLKPRHLKLHHYELTDEEADLVINNGILPDKDPVTYDVPYIRKEIDMIMKERLLHLNNTRR